MKFPKQLLVAAITLSSLIYCQRIHAQAAPQSDLQKKVEQYLRHIYAFGPDVKLVVPAPKDSEVTGIMETTIELTMGESHETAKMYISKDGKYLFRGEVLDMAKDTLAETRSKIDLKDAPVVGAAGATVTIVEFADFECPVCRQLHDGMRSILPNYPQARFIFKDFPIEQIHPWARTAALASRCAYRQDPKAFWKLYDSLYDSQDLITAANVWDKAVDFAGQARLDQATFKSCLASPEAAAALDASVANAKLLEVSSTPTLFINGRRVVGADTHTIEQYIQYELANQKPAVATQPKKQ